jgi:hypothetical protein
MTRTPDPTTITTNEQEGSADPRPAWERIAYTWLAREVDGGQPVDPATLPAEVSVALDLARDLLRLLRAQQNGDPGLGELRARLVRDRITDAYLRRELARTRRTCTPTTPSRSAPGPSWCSTVRSGRPLQTNQRRRRCCVRHDLV